MTVRDVLRQRRDEIVGQWFDEVMGTYPDGGERFRTDRDAFRNPVGTTVRRELPVLFDGVLGDADAASTAAALEALVRLRSVQGFAPSEAIGFVFSLKRLLREAADRDAADAVEAADIERRIETLGLEAFDLFVGWREKLFELRVREAKAHVHTLLRRAGMLVEIEDEEVPEGEPSGRGEKGGREA